MTGNLDDFELIVHIGTGKTGSSSIQKTLSANIQELENAGVAYLGLMFEHASLKLYPWQRAGAWPELIALPNPQASEQLQNLLIQTLGALAQKSVKRAIWSNESIFGSEALIIPVLKKVELLGVKIKIIVYIRRHDAYLRSAYLQWGIKHKTYRGPVKPFMDWRKGHRPGFYGSLKPWLDTQWSDIAVRNFDASGDVVRNFLEYYGLNERKVEIKRENETPNAVALALWNLYNSQCDEPVLPIQLQQLLKQANILGKAPVDCDFTSLLPNQEDLTAVKEETTQDRNRINEVFKRFSQPEMDVSPLKLKEMVVTQNQINAALLMMVKSLSDQVTRLNRQVKVLTKEDSANV